MRRSVILVLGALSLGILPLGACSPGASAGNETAANDSRRANEAAAANVSDAGVTNSRSLQGLGAGTGAIKNPAATSASASGGGTEAVLIGRWTDNGNCKQDIEFMPGGRFRSYTGGEGTWSLEGDALTIAGPGGTFRLTLRSVEPDRIVTVDPQGNVGQSTRCA